MESPEFKYDDLVNREKVDWEKIKLALEIDSIQQSKKEKEEITKKWWNKENAKLTVVIILTGIVIFATNFGVNHIKSNQDVDFKFKEANADHFFSLTDKYDTEKDTISLTNLSQKISSFTIYNNDNLDSIIKAEKEKFGRIYLQLINITLSKESINADSENNQESAEFFEKI